MVRRALLAVLLVAAACSGDDTDEPAVDETTTTAAAPDVYDGHVSETYADDAHWLCRPDTDDVCDADMDATVVRDDGTTSVERFEPAEDAEVDCFYIYPTISTDPGANSDLVPGDDQELFVVRQQAARLGAVCDVYAPVYRQTTLTSLIGRLGGGAGAGADSRVSAYEGVLDAWKHYVDNDNRGRGVILVGHSQGAGLLSRLVQEEIDPDDALRSRLVSAMLIGITVHASDFTNVQPCTEETPTGCIVSYASFRATAPPPAGTFFARPGDDGEPAICTNPSGLAPGESDLDPYFAADGGSLPIGGPPEAPTWAEDVEVTTPFVSLPGLVSGECVERDGFHYLELRLHPDPATPRIDDVGGDLTPEWGMHLIDVSVAMGDLVELAGLQARAYSSS